MTTTRLALFGAMVLTTSVSAGCSYAHIGSGEVGVVRTPDGMSPGVLPTGDWRIGFFDKVTAYNVRSQEQDERLEVLAANGLKIALDASIRYHVVAKEALQLDQELGSDYYATLIGPTLRSQSRRVVGRYQPEEIYSKERELIERQIREGIEAAIKGRHIVLEAVLIRNVQLPDTIQMAINNKLEAEQHALKMKYVIEEAKAQSEKEMLEAKALAERNKIQAEDHARAIKIDAAARAEAKRLEGQALADYQHSITQNLNEQILRYYQIQATRDLSKAENAKIIYMGSGAAPNTLLDLRKAGAPYDR
ncbi:MAG TPA: SPFH domain-containing protein [Minicystis sp.]|nr:SPFH domain-containing protein [Minicystis sp.]